MAILIGINSYANYTKETQEKVIREQQLLQEQQKQNEERIKQQAIEEEKARTPRPSITLLSGT